MTETEHVCQCPYCGHKHTLASPVDGYGFAGEEGWRPKDGDASFCISCGVIGIFEADSPGGVRRPNPAEQEQLDGDRDIARIKRAWKETRRNLDW